MDGKVLGGLSVLDEYLNGKLRPLHGACKNIFGLKILQKRHFPGYSKLEHPTLKRGFYACNFSINAIQVNV